VSHANAPLAPQGRLLLCQRIEAGSPIAHVASAMGISRRCASKWWHLYLELRADGLFDRSSRPRSSPGQTPSKVEERICRLRRTEKLGPDRLGRRLGIPGAVETSVEVHVAYSCHHSTVPISMRERETATEDGPNRGA
jgi:hypothetical protein